MSTDPAPPLVSICIPVYNKAPFIEHTIRLALAQTHPNIEVVASDNGSTDGSGDIIQRLAKEDPRISYYRFPKTVDVDSSWRCAIELSKGEYCKYLGGDDAIHPEFVTRLLAAMAGRPDIGFASCRTEARFDIQLPPDIENAFRGLQDQYRAVHLHLAALPDRASRARFLVQHAGNVNRLGDLNPILFKRSSFPLTHWRHMAGSPGGGWSYPDWDFLVRLFLNHRGVYVDEMLTSYVYNRDSPCIRVADDKTMQIFFLIRDVLMPFNMLSDPDLWAVRRAATPEQLKFLADQMTLKMEELRALVAKNDALLDPVKWTAIPGSALGR